MSNNRAILLQKLEGFTSLFFLKSQSDLAKLELRIFSIQSKPNQDNIKKNHAVLGMAKLAVIRRDLQ